MQKIIAHFAALTCLALLCAGCAGAAATQLGSTFSSMNPSASSLDIHNQTQLQLQEGNFSMMKTNVTGQARGFSLLGFITVSPARFQMAMDRLYANAQMQSGRPQIFANLIVEKTSAYWILFSIPRVSVRADLIEFTPERPMNIVPHSPGKESAPVGE